MGGGQNVDFRRATVFCLGYRLLKPKMTTYAKNLGSHGPLPTSMMLGEAVKDKLSLVPLYNDAVSSWINDVSDEILNQLLADLRIGPTKFSLLLDDTTDVANLNQLRAFARNDKGLKVEDEFLFCKQRTTTTNVKSFWMTSFQATVFRGAWFQLCAPIALLPCPWQGASLVYDWVVLRTPLSHSACCTKIHSY